MAPRGSSRRALAERVARATGGRVEPFFFHDAEPSKVDGMGRFYNLTPGFAVLNDGGAWPWCSFVDDVTIIDDLDPTMPSKPGWHRIVSDDERLLELASSQADPRASIETILEPLAALWRTELQLDAEAGMARVTDRRGRPVAVALGLPSERERPCEVVTAPLEDGDLSFVAQLLVHAKEAAFVVPVDGGTHLHFDGASLNDAAALRNLGAIVVPFHDVLRQRVGTSGRRRRLGRWSDETIAAMRAPEFAGLEWAEARQRLLGTEPKKYVDVNILNIVQANRLKPTVEFRMLPATLVVEDIQRWGELCVRVLRRAVAGPPIPWQSGAPLAATPDNQARLDRLLEG